MKIQYSKIPDLEHTSNETGRLLFYSIHKKKEIFFHLVKDVTNSKGTVTRDIKFLYVTFNYERLFEHMMRHGFVPLAPHLEDDKDIVMTFI